MGTHLTSAKYERGAPTDHVVSGEWPNAILDGDPGAQYAQRIARRLQQALDTKGMSMREVARCAGVAHATVAAVLQGRNFADIRTIGLLEDALYTNLLFDPNRAFGVAA